MLDNHGRNINYLRISVTDHCNLRCLYCMPNEGVAQKKHTDILRIEEIEQIVDIAVKLGINSIRITGGEPLVRKGVVDLIQYIHHIPEIQDISLTTNGVYLPQYAQSLKNAGLNRVNISLDSLDPRAFRYITRCGTLEDTLEGIKTALKFDFNPVKINVVAIRSLKQNYYEIAKLALKYPLNVRFIEFMPIGTTTTSNESLLNENDIVFSDEILSSINDNSLNNKTGILEKIDSENKPFGFGPATYYRFPQGLGTVGFITSRSNHFCDFCNRIRLTADGKLRPCLFSDKEYDIGNLIKQHYFSEAYELFNEAILEKPDAHHFKIGTDREMSQIGG